jgi:hypothetical protein
MDATFVTQAGIAPKPRGQEGVMAFVVVLLDPALAVAIVHRQRTASMKVDDEANHAKDELISILATAGVEVLAFASGGDSGTNACHTQFSQSYADLLVDASPYHVIDRLQAQEKVQISRLTGRCR